MNKNDIEDLKFLSQQASFLSQLSLDDLLRSETNYKTINNNFKSEDNNFKSMENAKQNDFKKEREESAKKYLLNFAEIRDCCNSYNFCNLTSELKKAFDFGMTIIEFENSYYLHFTSDSKKYADKFVMPLNSLMLNSESAEYSFEVQDTLGGLEPDGENVKLIEYEKLYSAKMEYRKKIKSAEIQRLMFAGSEEEDKSELWKKFIKLGEKFDGEKMKKAINKIYKNGAVLRRSARFGLIIDVEGCETEFKKEYAEVIKPYLFIHKEWLMRTLKIIS
ncbi:MAG: hypothetical protein IJ728_06525 [Selenomonadaceae bacterium]|nr:hypothetical protein [Selenomonadaceae bacterium]